MSEHRLFGPGQIDVGHDDLRTARSERPGRGPPDSRSGAGDDGGLAAEAVGHSSPHGLKRSVRATPYG